MFKSGQKPQNGCFSAAGRPQEGKKFTVENFQVKSVENEFVSKPFHDIFQFYDGRRYSVDRRTPFKENIYPKTFMKKLEIQLKRIGKITSRMKSGMCVKLY